MQPGAAWSGEQLSAGRLESGFVRGGTIQHGDQRGMKKRGGHRPTKHRRRSQSELFAAVGRHTACESTFMDDRSCMCKEMQAANDKTTKRCFPSTAQRPSNRTGHRTQRLLLHAASLISALTCDRASCTQNGKGDGSLTPLPHHHYEHQLLLTQSTAYFNFTDIHS